MNSPRDAFSPFLVSKKIHIHTLLKQSKTVMETRFELSARAQYQYKHFGSYATRSRCSARFFLPSSSIPSIFFYKRAQKSLLSNDLFGNQSLLSSFQFNLQFENYLFNRLKIFAKMFVCGFNGKTIL